MKMLSFGVRKQKKGLGFPRDLTEGFQKAKDGQKLSKSKYF